MLLLTPELYAPLRVAGRAVPRQRRRAGRGRAHPRPARAGHAGGPGGRPVPGLAGDPAGRGDRRAARPGRPGAATGSTCGCAAARWSRWSDRAAPARARSPPCCSACAGRTAAGSPWTASTSARSTRTGGAGRSAGCRSGRRCSAAPSGTTSPSATRRPRPSGWPRRPGWPACAEFVAELRLGYDTRIGAGGRGLSAGEQRRIALARALLRDAPLLVLDEPTANLDPETAAVVADAIAPGGRGPGRAGHRAPPRPRRRPSTARSCSIRPRSPRRRRFPARRRPSDEDTRRGWCGWPGPRSAGCCCRCCSARPRCSPASG